MNVAHCKLQDTTHIPLASIISLFVSVFSTISKMSIVHQAFKEAYVDFSCRFLGLQMQLLSHKTYNASNQFSRQQLLFFSIRVVWLLLLYPKQFNQFIFFLPRQENFNGPDLSLMNVLKFTMQIHFILKILSNQSYDLADVIAKVVFHTLVFHFQFQNSSYGKQL